MRPYHRSHIYDNIRSHVKLRFKLPKRDPNYMKYNMAVSILFRPTRRVLCAHHGRVLHRSGVCLGSVWAHREFIFGSSANHCKTIGESLSSQRKVIFGSNKERECCFRTDLEPKWLGPKWLRLDLDIHISGPVKN